MSLYCLVGKTIYKREIENHVNKTKSADDIIDPH
jgi:hypothetical protein